MKLADLAPRLARARDQWIVVEREAMRVRLAAADRLLDLQRLVAHRELQLVRALSSGSGRYIREPQGKLNSAQRSLASLQKRIAA